MNYPNNVIEDLLQTFKQDIGIDYDKYKNHVYRVFLNCLIIDSDRNNEEKYATAAVFHDIGIWTNHTIDYLNPSIEQARVYLSGTANEEWIEEITLMIYWHHKTGKYKGGFERTVECFRKADWIDVSLGLLTYGFNRREIKANRKKLPNKGFHFFLVKKIVKNFFRHPVNPLPMFRR
ncbi:MAG: HD domain-containing protein [Bacteroidota bacterium]